MNDVKSAEVKYGFGPHLMLDCFGCPREKLADVDFIFNFLDTFPDEIKMTKIMQPSVFKYHGKTKADWGISGVVLIAESHISIHTFPDKHHAFIDIFSCKDFNTDQACARLLQIFEASQHEAKVHSRRLDTPKDLVGGSRIFH